MLTALYTDNHINPDLRTATHALIVRLSNTFRDQILFKTTFYSFTKNIKTIEINSDPKLKHTKIVNSEQRIVALQNYTLWI